MRLTIITGRQYGKTTTLNAAEDFLSKDYLILSLSFEGMADSFSFNKNKTPGTKTMQIGDKTITEAVI